MAEWKRSWNSLAVRLMLSFSAFVIVVTAVFSVSPYVFVKSTLEHQMLERGKERLKKMAVPLENHLLWKDAASIREYLNDVVLENPGISYAAVADDNGLITQHTDSSFVGKALVGFSPTETAAYMRKEGRYKGKRVLEVSVPVEHDGKRMGIVVIGENYREMDAVLSRLLLRLGGVGLFVLAVSLLSTRPFTTHVVSGLTRLGKITREVARGELREKVPEEGFEEIRALARDFNAMAENLREVLGQIQEAGANVGAFSSEIQTVIQGQAASASQQATSVAEVTATMEELSRTSRQIAQNAEAVKEAASKSVEVAQAGTTLGREGVEAMAQIKERVGDIARKTLFLGEKSHEIGKVMEIIKEIASEIHLLALNAAIESAAAGEHGRRFAVVASEVRRLAEKTRESTETIRGIITEIQSATNSSVEATEQGTKEVEHWKETIRLSSEAFSEIIETIERTSEASAQISLATHQQTSANEQVVQAMRQIEETVRVAALQMKESSTSALRLREMARKLQEKAAVFHV